MVEKHFKRFRELQVRTARRIAHHAHALDAIERRRAVVRIAGGNQRALVVGKENVQTRQRGVIHQARAFAQLVFQQWLESPCETGERLAFVGVRHFQIQCAKLFGRGGYRCQQRRQAVAFRQFMHFPMQSQQLAYKGKLPVSQARLALQHDEAAVFGRFDRFGLGFFNAIALEAGAAVD